MEYAESDRNSVLKRLARLQGRPVLVCGNKNDYLKEHPKLGTFTFLPVSVNEILDIPDGPVIHRRTDQWGNRNSLTREVARYWLAKHTSDKK